MKSKVLKCLVFWMLAGICVILFNLPVDAYVPDYVDDGYNLSPYNSDNITTEIMAPKVSTTEGGEEFFKSSAHVRKDGTAEVSDDLLDSVRAALEALIKDAVGYCSDELLSKVLNGNQIKLGDIDLDGDKMPDISITFEDVKKTTRGEDGEEVTKIFKRITITKYLAWGSDVVDASAAIVDNLDKELSDMVQITMYTKIGANGLPIDSLTLIHYILNGEERWFKITRSNMKNYGVDGQPKEYDEDQEQITEDEAMELLKNILEE